ncbi:MAG: mechanosensitive ion channel domain-containing protein [Paracoccaceae bacterium]
MTLDGILAQIEPIWTATVDWMGGMLLPYRVWQFVILIACAGAALLTARLIDPPIDAWMRSRKGLSTRQLRIMIAVARRSKSILLALYCWLAVFVVRSITVFPSRSYIVSLGASLALAWVVVALSARLIRNPLLRKVTRFTVWIYIALRLLNMTDDAIIALDSAAINLGGLRLSALMVVQAMATLAVLFFFVGLVNNAARKRLENVEGLSPSMRMLSEKGLRLALYGLAIVIGLQTVGFDLTSLTVLSGAIGLGIGFGLQKVVSNLVAGMILLVDKSIKPGDVITIDQTFGWITDLSARYVSVKTRDGREYLVPNEDMITGQVVNWSHSNDLVRLDVAFGTAYNSDPHEVRKLAREAAVKANRVVHVPPPQCHITGFGDSSVDYLLRFWIRDPIGGLTNIRGDVYLQLWDALKAANIEIPFPQRDVNFRNMDQRSSPTGLESSIGSIEK